MREMKDSGISWLGNIPESWNIIRVKNIFKNHKDIVGEKENEFDRLALTLNGVIKRDKDDIKGLQSESLSTYQILNKNELVFKMIDLANVNTSRVGFSPYTGIVSPVYIILNNDKYSRYGYYYFYSMWQREIFNNLGNDGVRSALNVSDMLNLPFPDIPENEAIKIADFLDEKIKEIDNAIIKTKETIEDYKKYKKSNINKIVTKGLDKNVELVDSKIEEIGFIPKNWKLNKIKYIVDSLTKGAGITKEEVIEDGDIQCVRYGEIYTKYETAFSDTCSRTNMILNPTPRYINYGNILFAVTGELVEEIGKNIVYLGKEKCLVGGDIIVASHSQSPRFMNYAFNSISSQMQKSKGKTKLKVVHISASEIGNIRVAYPNKTEQEEIADYLDSFVNEVNKVIKCKEKIIEQLENYKKSVIYEYVTGKKEVN